MKSIVFLWTMAGVCATAQTSPNNFTPTPEPATMLLLGDGLVGFGFLSARARKRPK